jgi:hypothetical protein
MSEYEQLAWADAAAAARGWEATTGAIVPASRRNRHRRRRQGSRRAASPQTVRLADDQLDALAARIAARLARHNGAALIDAATLAAELGVDRSWIYAHAAELGAMRLGNGSRGVPLRFDRERARQAFVTVGDPTPEAPRSRRRKLTQAPGSILASRPRV